MKKLLISLLLGLGLTSLIGCGTMNKKVTNSEQIEQTQDLSKYDKRQYNTVIFTEEDYEMDKRINKDETVDKENNTSKEEGEKEANIKASNIEIPEIKVNTEDVKPIENNFNSEEIENASKEFSNASNDFIEAYNGVAGTLNEAIPEMNKGMKDSNEALQKALEGQKQIEDVICK